MTIATKALFVIGLLSIALGCNRHSLTVDDVIERNSKAMGGRAALQAVNSIEVDLHIVDPGFEVDGIYRAVRPGRMRIDVQAGGKHVFTEAFDGQNGWQWNGKDNQKPASPKAAAPPKAHRSADDDYVAPDTYKYYGNGSKRSR